MRKPMPLRYAAFVISMLLPLAAGDLSTRIVTVSETKTLDAAPAGTLHLQNSRGEVTIEGWDQPRVEITVIKSTTGLFRPSDPAPRDSKIVFDAGNGGVYLTGMAGDIRATVQHGQITLLLPKNADYSVDARA